MAVELGRGQPVVVGHIDEYNPQAVHRFLESLVPLLLRTCATLKSPMSRYFTLNEASATLTVIRPLLTEILKIRQSILEKQPEVWPVFAKAAGNGGSRTARQVEHEFTSLSELVHQIQATGAVLKDLDQGLIDFLAMRDGREIYLC